MRIMSDVKRTSVTIEPEDHAQLLRAQGVMQAEAGHRVPLSVVISRMIDTWTKQHDGATTA